MNGNKSSKIDRKINAKRVFKTLDSLNNNFSCVKFKHTLKPSHAPIRANGSWVVGIQPGVGGAI